MDEFANRSQLCKKHLADESLPKWRRIDLAMAAWRGLDLASLNPEIRSKLDRHLLAINSVFSRYQISSVEDYRRMSLDDLDAIAEELRALDLLRC